MDLNLSLYIIFHFYLKIFFIKIGNISLIILISILFLYCVVQYNINKFYFAIKNV